jgi:nicotinamidase/pyrazinamidase
MKALLIVDLQNDFCPGGRLPVPEGDKIISVVNRLIDQFPLAIASKDWHPVESKHFEKWPVHCIRNSKGAEIHPDLKSNMIDKIFLKGTGNEDDGYSAFEATNFDLEGFLKDSNVEELYIVGLATEYCVKATALDAVKKGFVVYIIEEGVAGIKPEDIERSIKEMEREGVNFISELTI